MGKRKSSSAKKGPSNAFLRAVEPVTTFFSDANRLLLKCDKPTPKGK